jgi:hypothetical protein
MIRTWTMTIAKLKRFGPLVALLLGACPCMVLAVEIPITNSGFELPDAGGTFVGGVPDGWLASEGLADVFVENTASVGMSGGDGIQFGGMDSNNGAGSYIYQDLGIPFEAGMAYKVDIAGAHRDGFGHGVMEFGVFSSNSLGTDLGTPGFIDLEGFATDSGNPDADNMLNVFRYSSSLENIGTGALGSTSDFSSGSSPPSGNVVVYIRGVEQGARLNFDDISLDVAAGFQPGDVDEDGDVDLIDYEVIRSNFRLTPASKMQGDIVGANVVDMEDFLLWRSNYPFPGSGAIQSSSAHSVPEPATLLLSSLAFFVLVKCRAGRDTSTSRPRIAAAQ